MFADEFAPTLTRPGNRIATSWSTDVVALKVRVRITIQLGLNFKLLSENASSDCTEDHKHMHINYYGECKEIEDCQKDILEDFPRRMREWLDNIIRYGDWSM